MHYFRNSRQNVPTTQVNGNGVPPPKPKRGFDNQGMDHTEEFALHAGYVVGSRGDVVGNHSNARNHSDVVGSYGNASNSYHSFCEYFL